MMKMIVFWLVLSSSVAADEYVLGKQTLELPFPKSSLVATERPKENLLFLDPKSSMPRPVVSVTLSAFRFPSEDLSAFEERFRREKVAWLKKEQANQKGDLEFKALEKEQAYIARLEFENALGHFHEWSRVQDCANGESVSLKMMVPERMRRDEPETWQKWSTVLDQSLCGK